MIIGTLLYSTTPITTSIIVIIHISYQLRTSDCKQNSRIRNISLHLHQNLGYSTDVFAHTSVYTSNFIIFSLNQLLSR